METSTNVETTKDEVATAIAHVTVCAESRRANWAEHVDARNAEIEKKNDADLADVYAKWLELTLTTGVSLQGGEREFGITAIGDYMSLTLQRLERCTVEAVKAVCEDAEQKGFRRRFEKDGDIRSLTMISARTEKEDRSIGDYVKRRK